jgi:signal transduction histidine kinase/CheY-like chemotaxis protein
MFLHILTNRYYDKEYETTYTTERYTNIKKKNFILGIVNILFSVICTILLSSGKYQYITLEKQTIKFPYYIIAYILMLFQLSVLVLIFLINRYQRALIYLNFTILSICLKYFELYADSGLQNKYVFSIVIVFSQLFRLAYYVLGMLDFIDGLIFHVFTNVIVYFVFFKFVEVLDHLNFLYVFIIHSIFSFLICYFYIRQKKQAFYDNFTLAKRNYDHQSVLEHMNSGFITMENYKLDYLNKPIFRTITKNKKLLDIVTLETGSGTTPLDEDVMKLSQGGVYLLLKELLNGLILNGKEFNKGEDVVDNIFEILKFSHQQEGFTFLGTKCVELDVHDEQETIYYEIFGRCFKKRGIKQNCDADFYEFIFNDVSRSTLINEANIEFKYKSLFLSKVAHEFKNPLLCISELADQVSDIISITKKEKEENASGYIKEEILKGKMTNITGTIQQIKAMSDYLIILVKDMDYFSQNHSNKAQYDKHKLEKDIVKLDNIINFCRDVTNGLLKKFQKESSVNFSVNFLNLELVPKDLFIDEIKLKQILINLLSNSVKYTTNGSILLRITGLENQIEFCIKDTGSGISDHVRARLFTPFAKYGNNSISSGLGLSIVKELLELFGSKLEYETIPNQGTTFTFLLKNDIPSRGPSRRLITTRIEKSIKESNSLTNTPIFNTAPVFRREDTFNKRDSKYSYTTIAAEFNPDLDKLNKYLNVEDETIEKIITSGRKLEFNDVMNIIVVDDEINTRKSTVRIIKSYCDSNDLKINIREAEDGIECLFLYYQSMKKGKPVSFIVSDQTMNVMDGSMCAAILHDIANARQLQPVPFFILTAYENFSVKNGNTVRSIYSKPLTKNNIDDMLMNFL